MRKFQRKESVVSRKENNGLILFNTVTGEPYFIEGTGIDIWDVLKDKCTINDIKERLHEKYEDDPNMEDDISEFLNDILKEGLINVF